MLAVPMCLLYEAGLFVARFIGVREKAEGQEKGGQSNISENA
jgi:Sec-independent protein secretion pathway component TatC